MAKAGIGYSTETIEQFKKAVKEICENSRFYSHTAWEHLLDTAEKARFLGEKVGADVGICWLGGLLHDIGAVEGGPEDHHISGAEIAEKMLNNFCFPGNVVKAVQHCIFAHRGSQSVERTTIEAKVVASADAMSHFGRVSELIKAACSDLGKSPEEAKDWTREKVRRSWEKLMPEAKAMAQEAYDSALKSLSG